MIFMDFFQEIVVNVLAKEEARVTFPNLKFSVSEILEIQCFDALKKIKTIIENDSLNDFECVEEIVCVFEQLGSSCGSRHDFS